ncbi:hypothetical protein NP493_35g03000 [Ridgeia piscesae]|uniref:Uncharacterized protein n=1 Tax=Ridgeia piscesae TaxID=27915 RepID=A0AAD9PCK1_RIDPI|nr:hypothetical protein NP493_35g03000 [Ridgeia piscesae]
MSDHDSSGTSSALKLPAITFKTSRPLPELWTLPREWNMEKREKYDTWKMDVQYQIAYLQRKFREVTTAGAQQHREQRRPAPSYHDVKRRRALRMADEMLWQYP